MLVAYCIFLIFIVTGSVATLHQNRDIEGTVELKNEIGPNVKVFETVDSLLSSNYLDMLFTAQDIEDFTNNTIYIQQLDSLFYVTDIKKDSSKFKKLFNLENEELNLLEVKYGKGFIGTVDGLALSPCISNVVSSGSSTYTHQLTSRLDFKFNVDAEFGVTIRNPLSITFGAPYTRLVLSVSNSGSVVCRTTAGHKVQVFGKVHYVNFPEAKSRNVVFSRRSRKMKSFSWNAMTCEPNFGLSGALFHDKKTFPNYECVTDERELQCDSDSIFSNNKLFH